MTRQGQERGDQGLLEVEPRQPRKDTIRWLFTGARPEPPASRVGTLEDPRPGRVGICCSGGGIRSAAFNLGALQAIQERGVLRTARYLAAVSGGAYIASAFSMVAKTGTGADHHDSDPEEVTDARPPFFRGSPEEQYLRNRCSYLAPDGLSKLFLVFRVLLGLVFNVVFLGLALFAIGVALAYAVYAPLYGALDECVRTGTGGCRFTADVPSGFWVVVAVLGVGVLADGLLLLLLRPGREFWRAGLEAWAIRLMLALGAVALVVLVVPLLAEVLLNVGDERGGQAAETVSTPALPAVGAGSFAAVLVAVLLQLRARAAEPATVIQVVKGARGAFMRLGRRARLVFAYLAGAIAGPLLLLVIVIASSAWALGHISTPGSDRDVLLMAVGAAALFGLLYVIADLNTWSLHPFYRYRLCHAFALRRVRDADGEPVAAERPYETLVQLSQSEVSPTGWPTLVVCAAANVSDPGATPPGRGVTSFTFSSNAIGGPLVGARPTEAYEKALGRNRLRDITLPAAVAMSGAALSPSMGKETRRPLTFLMALANARLGVWVPNPLYVGDAWTQRFDRRDGRSPRDVFKMPRPSYLIRELFGRNRLDARFLYVTDGGHYENLGLVELLRRGCTTVYCFDASGGESFAALGDAIALARSELCVEIEIDPSPLVSDAPRQLAARDCVSGRIRYPDGTQGVLVYARSVMTESVPFDVTAYHDADPVFPHHSTADQLYTDQKFEAYRALGWCAGIHADDECRRPRFEVKEAAEPVGEVSRDGDGKSIVSVPHAPQP
jgi:hypothetical protein